MKKYFLSILAICLYGSVTSQNIVDITYLNNPVTLGTPRFAATGGAFTSLGNDFSAIHVNPAGLAVFRHDEFGITMGYGGRTVSSSYYDINQSANDGSFLFTNVGYVKKMLTKNEDITWNFGISYNRNADLRSKSKSLGTNPQSSILQQWIRNANGFSPQGLFENGLIYEGLAWETFLIDKHPDLTYSTQAVFDKTEQYWDEEINARFDELAFTFAVDQSNKLYYGLSLNVPFYKYDNKYYYTEGGFQGDSIKGLEWYEEFSNRGAGFNIKLGAIFRPVSSFRIGASIWSPSWMSISQTYYTEINAKYWNGSNKSAAFEQNGAFQYSIRTAPQANLGLSWVFNKSGFLTVDYAFIATKWSKTNTSELSYLNADINNYMSNQHNIRFGAEIRIVNFFVRGGYSWLSSPFNIDFQDSPKNTYSLGLGYRTNKITFDISYNIATNNYKYYPYSPELVQPASQTITRKPFLASISFRL